MDAPLTVSAERTGSGGPGDHGARAAGRLSAYAGVVVFTATIAPSVLGAGLDNVAPAPLRNLAEWRARIESLETTTESRGGIGAYGDIVGSATATFDVTLGPERAADGQVEASWGNPVVEPRELARALHAESGLSWQQLAAVIGVSPRSLHLWVRGGPIASKNHQRLATAYRVLVEELPNLASAERRAAAFTPSGTHGSPYERAVREVRGDARPALERGLSAAELASAGGPE